MSVGISLSNIAGTASANFNITVVGPPGKPKFVGPDTVSRDSCTITWSPPVDDGGDALTGYYIERREETSSTWIEVGEEDYDLENIDVVVDHHDIKKV